MPYSLTAEETDILARLDDKERIVRSRIRTIALPTYTGVRGFFFHGDPGHGKTSLLRSELDNVYGPGKWLLYNSDMSPPALLAEMESRPERALVLEDCEQLLNNVTNRGILRSAMAPPYRVNPKNMKADYDFIFCAPIYIVSNLPLNERHGVLAAIASRSGPIWWHLTRPELAARMKEIALRGGDSELTLAERWEVAEYCIEQLNMDGRVDLRTLCDVGFPVRRLYKSGELGIDWRDYIDSYVRGTVETPRRAERIAREQRIACEVYLDGKNTSDRHRLWERRTRLKKTAFHDRLREARATELFDQCKVQRRALGSVEEQHVAAEVEGDAHDEESLVKKFQLYRTPPHVTQAIIRLESIQGSVLEPCVGKGDLARELLHLPNAEVKWSDIHDWGFSGTIVQDFLTIVGEHYDVIVTNPPHSNPAGFVRQAKTLADKVIMLLSLYVEHNVGWSDLRNDGEYPLKAIYAFTQSIRWVGWKGSLSGKLKYGWFVFEKGYSGPTLRKSITFDRDGQMTAELNGTEQIHKE